MTERHTPSSDFDDWNQEVATVRYRVMVGISVRGRIAHPLDRTKQSVPANQVSGAHCGARGNLVSIVGRAQLCVARSLASL